MNIEAKATNGPRQRVSEAALEKVALDTLGGAKRTPEGLQRNVVLTLEFPGSMGKQYVRLTTDAATQLIARLTQSLGAALVAFGGE